MEINEIEYYSRHLPLHSIGKEGQKLLKNRHVLVAGVGGLGSTVASILVGFGVGKITLMDFDSVDISNLHRQHLYTINDIGKSKVEVAANVLRQRNPFVDIRPLPITIDGLSLQQYLDDVDVIIDGLDTYSTRRVLNFHSVRQKIPYIFAGAIAEEANIAIFNLTSESPCLNCIFDDMVDTDNNRCSVMGVNPSILYLTASIQADQALKILTDRKPELDTKLLRIDLDGLSFLEINVQKNLNCNICSKEKANEGKLGEERHETVILPSGRKIRITSLCGRDTIIVDPKIEKVENWQDWIKEISQHFQVKSTTDYSVSLRYQSATATIMESGLVTIRGAGSKEKAIRISTKLFKLMNE